MERVSRLLPRTLYGLLFVGLLPACLLLWAVASQSVIRIPTPQSFLWGMTLSATGLAILIAGMSALWVRGGGLPMNAFPPPRFVRSGIYALIPHPIYGGFVLVCAGASIAFGSASGLWLVTPTLALACTALVLGFEQPDLRSRFGAEAEFSFLSPRNTSSPTFLQRLRVSIAILLPWLACYGMIWSMGPTSGAFSNYLPFERRLPVLEWTEIPYASTYVVVILVPFMVRTSEGLRKFARRGLLAMLLVFSLYLLLPVFVQPRPFQPSTAAGHLLAFERTPFSGAAAFPSFHVVWALIAASVLGEKGRALRLFWWTWAILVSASCVTTGMHSILDVLAGLVAFWLIVKMGSFWTTLLRCAERIANSWHEWRIGPMRIINHGGYAAIAAFVGVLLIDALFASGGEFVAASIFGCAILGAALWAQWIEGSPALLRPLGFYGGMTGAVVGATPALFVRISLWVALAAVCMAAPWIQAIGRLRCLVQGCCHGRATQSVEGICYSHPRSRVCRLAHLRGIPVHATPLYSILWNLWTGLMLLRLVSLHCAPTLIAGIYLILSGAGRFVEEAYRGEPQTKTIGGLRLYQWIAIFTVVLGSALTAVNASAAMPAFEFRWPALLLALVCGSITWFVSGVDFPESSRRFARLT